MLNEFFFNLVVDEPKKLSCPQKCRCLEEFKQVNCSHQQLTSIPMDLPTNAVYLDLSFNELTTFDLYELSNFTQLQELIISNNHITAFINSSVCSI